MRGLLQTYIKSPPKDQHRSLVLSMGHLGSSGDTHSAATSAPDPHSRSPLGSS